MSYVVTSPLVLAIDQEGKTHHVYQGGVIEWLSDEQAEHFLSNGLVEKVGARRKPKAAPAEPEGDSDPVAEPADDVEVQVGEDGKPLRASTKPVLVQWLTENQSDYSRDELGEMHKDDLWALIDAK